MLRPNQRRWAGGDDDESGDGEFWRISFVSRANGAFAILNKPHMKAPPLLVLYHTTTNEVLIVLHTFLSCSLCCLYIRCNRLFDWVMSLGIGQAESRVERGRHAYVIFFSLRGGAVESLVTMFASTSSSSFFPALLALETRPSSRRLHRSFLPPPPPISQGHQHYFQSPTFLVRKGQPGRAGAPSTTPGPRRNMFQAPTDGP